MPVANGGIRKAKSTETKAAKRCLSTFSKSTWIMLYNLVCAGADFVSALICYAVFGSVIIFDGDTREGISTYSTRKLYHKNGQMKELMV